MDFAKNAVNYTTRTLDVLLLLSFAIYITLASTTTSDPTKDKPSIKLQRTFGKIAAFSFSIIFGVWGSFRWTNASSHLALSAVVIGGSFILAGSICDAYKNPSKDTATERFAATTAALYPALIGLTGAGVAKLLENYK